MFRICSRRLAHAVAKADSHATIPGLSADSNVVKHQGITAIAEDKHGHTGRVAIYVKAGPAYESKWNAGASQWLRHFGRKDGIVYSQFGFETALEEACVHLNNVELAGREYLVYSVEGNRDTLVQPELFDILWSNILFPKFHPFHINQARKYVQQDSADVQHHNPRRYLLDQVFATAYKGSALANSEFCPSYNIKGIKDDTLWDFWEQQYTFDNISLVATNVDPHHVMDSAFGALWFQRAHVRRGAGKEANAKYSGGENQVIHHRASDYDEQFNDVYNTYTALAFKAPTTGKHSTATKIVAEAIRSHVQSRVGGHGGQVFVGDGLVGVIIANATTEKLNGIIDAVRNAPRDVDKAVPSLLVREAFRGDLRARTQQIFEASLSADSPTPATSKDIAGEVQSVVSGIFAAKPTLVHYGGSKAPPALDSLKF